MENVTNAFMQLVTSSTLSVGMCKVIR